MLLAVLDPAHPADVPAALALLAVTVVGYLIHCQREHVKRKVASRR